jgi:hypothetical protein
MRAKELIGLDHICVLLVQRLRNKSLSAVSMGCGDSDSRPIPSPRPPEVSDDCVIRSLRLPA